MSRFVRLFALVSGLLAPLALAWETTPPDWNALSTVEEIEVLSENSDGSRAETTVWLVVVDNDGYIRTGNTSWYPNLERKPEIGVRINGKDYPVTAQLVTEQSVIDAVVAEFAHKYGWSDTVRGWIIRAKPHIVKLVPRTA
jgi:hypothetical protein